MGGDRVDDRRPRPHDLRLGAVQYMVHLGPAADRLAERLGARFMQLAKQGRKRLQRLTKVVNPDQARIALQPRPARVPGRPPAKSEIRQEWRAIGRGGPIGVGPDHRVSEGEFGRVINHGRRVA